jgi:Predicted transcriptional regulator
MNLEKPNKIEVGKRITQLIAKLKTNNRRLADSIGIDASFMSKAEKGVVLISPKYVSELQSIHNVNPTWLLYGEGEMFGINVPNEITKNEFQQQLLAKKNGNKLNTVKFYDIDFAAGNIEFYDDNHPATYEMDLPNFKGCIAFRTYGDSMQPQIMNGTIVIAKEIKDWRDYIPFGEIYGIVTHDGRKYLKTVRKSTKPGTHITLHSENEKYDDWDLPLTKIKSMWLVCGSINKFAE